VKRQEKARWLGIGLIAGAVALAARPVWAPAHEIPSDITIRAIVKADSTRLRLLLRVPLRAMRDIQFPLSGPGYLVLDGVDPYLREAATTWIGNSVRIFEGSNPVSGHSLVATRVSIPSNRAFANYDDALEHILGTPLASGTQLHWQNAMLDMLLEYPIASVESRFSIEPNLERLALRVLTVLQFVGPDGSERVFQYVGDAGLVRLDPSWLQAALTFTKSGFDHILDGIDHLLFLLCLVIPFRRVRSLVPIITAFTVGHSITLIASAMGVAPNALWFPPFVETLIALSIVYMALENIIGARVERRWMIAFGFGLVHGFGFAFALRELLQFGGSHLLGSLLAFNVGVELGQLLVVLLLVPALGLFFRYAVKERMGTIILSALVAHTGWHWMTSRGEILMQYRIRLPAFSAMLFWSIKWLLLAALISAGAWLLGKVYRTTNAGRVARGTNAGANSPTKEAL
jgi:hypothetical protein